ncbi:MAG: hypothetical protein KatS3mg027_2365 [Bacteroidia bacterium]|nr:MAG: hypothetical protein KatS3mg027_2365 [Bacteroidia bacterium]
MVKLRSKRKSKKILIISSTHCEITTEKVIDWLIHFNNKFYRINGEEFHPDFSNEVLIHIDSRKCRINKRDLYKENFYSWWVRRIGNSITNLDSIENYHVLEYYKNNLLSLKCFVFNNVRVTNDKITNLFQIHVNKLYVLKIARKLKIRVPEYLITNIKQSIVDFYFTKKEKVVIKDINLPYFEKNKQEEFSSYTKLVDITLLNKLPQFFPPTFFQEYIEKEYEIRSFYLNGKFYSMAIMSQKDEQTKIDFRRYNLENPNRTVPYQLPTQYEIKLKKLMDTLHLNTGSLDIIKGKDGKYYFLEVNPVGQFGMVSYPCNYKLEKEIALLLSK